MHQRGNGASYTRRRLPVVLVWALETESAADAYAWEKQIQGWSKAKREALIEGRFDDLPALCAVAPLTPRGLDKLDRRETNPRLARGVSTRSTAGRLTTLPPGSRQARPARDQPTAGPRGLDKLDRRGTDSPPSRGVATRLTALPVPRAWTTPTPTPNGHRLPLGVSTGSTAGRHTLDRRGANPPSVPRGLDTLDRRETHARPAVDPAAGCGASTGSAADGRRVSPGR